MQIIYMDFMDVKRCDANLRVQNKSSDKQMSVLRNCSLKCLGRINPEIHGVRKVCIDKKFNYDLLITLIHSFFIYFDSVDL